MRALTKLARHWKWICLSDFGMVLTNILEWSLYWNNRRPQICMFIPNPNGWPYYQYKGFSRIFGNRLLILVVDLSAFCMELFEPMVKYLNGPWKKLLKVACMILHNNPARREDYESVTGSSTYLHRFCSTWY